MKNTKSITWCESVASKSLLSGHLQLDDSQGMKSATASSHQHKLFFGVYPGSSSSFPMSFANLSWRELIALPPCLRNRRCCSQFCESFQSFQSSLCQNSSTCRGRSRAEKFNEISNFTWLNSTGSIIDKYLSKSHLFDISTICSSLYRYII